MADRKYKSKQEYPNKPIAKYLVLSWHLQKLYVGLFEKDTEAVLYASSRNGVVVELIGKDFTIGSVDDYWRRDDQGRPMLGEWRTSRVTSKSEEPEEVIVTS